jgi:uncharacterized repeat protein (TIGR03803 family)
MNEIFDKRIAATILRALALATSFLVAATPALTQPVIYTNIHDFGGSLTNPSVAGLDGKLPQSGITVDAKGNLYGTASYGGSENCGMVWKISAAGTYSDAHDFGGNITLSDGTTVSDGVLPEGGVLVDSAGNLLGTTSQGGAYDQGMVWEITASGSYKDLHDFGGSVSGQPDGYQPLASVVEDSTGNLYGTAAQGGAYFSGMVWEIAKSGAYQDLHDFGGSVTNADGSLGSDGTDPLGVSLDSSGNLFGIAGSGGGFGQYEGMVFEISKAGVYTDLHDFGGLVADANGLMGLDGASPFGGVTLDAGGNLYGTAFNGGANYGGIIWKLSKGGSYQDLHDFGGTAVNSDGKSGPDGTNPSAGVTLDNAGNLYGTAELGGQASSPDGIVWELKTSGAYLDLHDFGYQATNLEGASTPDGAYPAAAITFDSFGDMYGATPNGGAFTVGIVWMLRYGVAALSLSPKDVVGGSQLLGTVTLGTAAPEEGSVVTLSSSSSEAKVPTSVTVMPGASSATFPISTTAVGTTNAVTITATQRGYAQQATLVIESPGLASVTINPTYVKGGRIATGSVTLTGSAPSGGTVVNLSSTLRDVTVPESVTVPSGHDTASFTIVTRPVSSKSTGTITTTLKSFSKSASFTIQSR